MFERVKARLSNNVWGYTRLGNQAINIDKNSLDEERKKVFQDNNKEAQPSSLNSRTNLNSPNQNTTEPTKQEPRLEAFNAGDKDAYHTNCRIKVPSGYTLCWQNMSYKADENGYVNFPLQKGYKFYFRLRDDQTGQFVKEKSGRDKFYNVEVNKLGKEELTQNVKREEKQKEEKKDNLLGEKRTDTPSKEDTPSTNSIKNSETREKEINIPEIKVKKVNGNEHYQGYSLCEIEVPTGYVLNCGNTPYQRNNDGKVRVWLQDGRNYNFYLRGRGEVVKDESGRNVKFYSVNTANLSSELNLNSKANVCEYLDPNFVNVDNGADESKSPVKEYTTEELRADARSVIQESKNKGQTPVFMSEFHGVQNKSKGTGKDSEWISIIAEESKKEGYNGPIVIAIHHCHSGISDEELTAMRELPEGSVVIKSQDGRIAWHTGFHKEIDKENCSVEKVFRRTK